MPVTSIPQKKLFEPFSNSPSKIISTNKNHNVILFEFLYEKNVKSFRGNILISVHAFRSVGSKYQKL